MLYSITKRVNFFINSTTELFNDIEGTKLSLPRLIVDSSSGGRKFSIVKALIPTHVYFIVSKYWTKI